MNWHEDFSDIRARNALVPSQNSHPENFNSHARFHRESIMIYACSRARFQCSKEKRLNCLVEHKAARKKTFGAQNASKILTGKGKNKEFSTTANTSKSPNEYDGFLKYGAVAAVPILLFYRAVCCVDSSRIDSVVAPVSVVRRDS